MKNIPGTLQEGGAAFQTTHWSVVLLAAQSQTPEAARQALASFCQAYWPPLYAFLRRRGHPSSDAQDLTQAFFAHLLEHHALASASRERGRLRTFLLGSLQNFLANEHDRTRALKRGGGKVILGLDEHFVEAEAAVFATDATDETHWYDQTWANTLVNRAWERLEEELTREDKARWLTELRPFLLGGTAPPATQEEVAARLGLPVATLRTWVRRLRQRYRAALRTEVARTVADPSEIDGELQYLHQVLMS